MRLASRIGLKLVTLWGTSIVVALVLAGAVFGHMIRSEYDANARTDLTAALDILDTRLAAARQGLSDVASELARQESLIAEVNLVSRYQDPAQYDPLAFDEAKRRVAIMMNDAAGMGSAHTLSIFDIKNQLIAFHVHRPDGRQISGFVGYDPTGRPQAFNVPAPPDAAPLESLPAGIAWNNVPVTENVPTNQVRADSNGLSVVIEEPIRRVLTDGSEEFVGTFVLSAPLAPQLAEGISAATGLNLAYLTPAGLHFGSSIVPPTSAPTDTRRWVGEDGERMLGIRRIRLDPTGDAVFLFEVPSTDLKGKLAAFRNSALFSLGMIAVFLLPAAAFLVRRTLGRPILDLISGVEKVAAGDYDALVSFRGNDELAKLASSFNKMAGRVRDRDARLRESQDSLEVLVAQRTEALTAEIEERKETEDQLTKLSLAVENSPAIVVITDPGGNIEYVNPRFSEITGYSPEEVIGHNPRIIKSDDTQEKTHADMWRTILSGEPWHGEFHNRRKDGSEYWVSAAIAPIRTEDGDIRHFVAVEEDITERKRMEDALRHAKEQAETANRAKSEFLSRMSHELRTPLNAILGFAQLLQSGRKSPLSDKQRGYVDHILDGGNHLLSLINEVLDLARIEAGGLSLKIDDVDPLPLMDECLALTETMAEERGVTLHTSEGTTGLPPIRADRVRLKQVLLNLLSNAVKYNREGGLVEVAADLPANGTLRVSVSDTGPGIPPERQAELFEPFARLGMERSGIEGSGIGLTITRKLVEQMGGSLGFASTPGEGSTFWFEVPLARPRKRPPHPDGKDGEGNSIVSSVN